MSKQCILHVLSCIPMYLSATDVHSLWVLFLPCNSSRFQQCWEFRQGPWWKSQGCARRATVPSVAPAAGSALLGCAAAALNNRNQHESSLYSLLNPSAVLWETISMSHCRRACCPLCLVTDPGIKWPRGRWRTGIVPPAAAWETCCKAEQTSQFSSFFTSYRSVLLFPTYRR